MRPKKTGHRQSMGAAAAALKTTVAALSALKKCGSLAFERNGNVDCDIAKADLEKFEEEIAKAESKDEANARVARARANRMEFELAVRRGQFIAIEDVRRIVTRAFVGCKTKMLAIGPSLAPRLAITSDPHQCDSLVSGSVKDALNELAKVKWNTSK